MVEAQRQLKTNTTSRETRVETPAVQDSGIKNHTVFNPEFTGTARSVECFDNQGHNNFRILTLHVHKGVVTKMDVSDPYANFECIAMLERYTSLGMFHLNNIWSHKRTLEK